MKSRIKGFGDGSCVTQRKYNNLFPSARCGQLFSRDRGWFAPYVGVHHTPFVGRLFDLRSNAVFARNNNRHECITVWHTTSWYLKGAVVYPSRGHYYTRDLLVLSGSPATRTFNRASHCFASNTRWYIATIRCRRTSPVDFLVFNEAIKLTVGLLPTLFIFT